MTSSLLLSFQSCPSLCDPTDGSPPGSPVPGILQARTLEWVAISFSLGSFNLLEILTELRETLMFTSLLKDVRRAQMNSQMKKYVGSGVGYEHKSFCPHEIGGCYPLRLWMCSPAWEFSEPCTVGILR